MRRREAVTSTQLPKAVLLDSPWTESDGSADTVMPSVRGWLAELPELKALLPEQPPSYLSEAWDLRYGAEHEYEMRYATSPQAGRDCVDRIVAFAQQRGYQITEDDKGVVRVYGDGVFVYAHRRQMFGELQLEARLKVRTEDGLDPGQALRGRIPLARFLSTLPPTTKPRMTRIRYAREVGQVPRAWIDYSLRAARAPALDGWLEQQGFEEAGRDRWSRGTAANKVSLLIVGDELDVFINPP